MTNPPWDELRAAAVDAAAHAYAPYSSVHVGAAGLTDGGAIVSGSNVENASYGCTLCAECSMVSGMVASGATKLTAVVVVAGDGRSLAPCGRCRQVLYEFGGDELLIDTDDGVIRLGELLPGAFGPDDVRTRRS